MKTFLFLYPQQGVIEHEVRKGAYTIAPEWERIQGAFFSERFGRVLSEKERRAIQQEARDAQAAFYRPVYAQLLNECIDARYRKKGFHVNYVLLAEEKLSELITHHEGDKIVYTDITGTTHYTSQPDGTHRYPNADYILNQVDTTEHLRVAGFHIWDCVTKMAQRAHERGINVLVDEDLTELLPLVSQRPDFTHERYPGTNPRREGNRFFEFFMDARRGVPWLWQDYPEVEALRS